MNRRRHPRRTTPTGDDASRVSNAARDVADCYMRLKRAEAARAVAVANRTDEALIAYQRSEVNWFMVAYKRLHEAFRAAEAAGLSGKEIDLAFAAAGKGRPDRAAALKELFRLDGTG